MQIYVDVLPYGNEWQYRVAIGGQVAYSVVSYPSAAIARMYAIYDVIDMPVYQKAVA